jgi:hypothetical protein
MVDDPRPPIKKVQAVQISQSSAESAPFIYFDEVVTAGVHQGNIRLELGASTAIPTADGQAKTVRIITAHLRCSPPAAIALRKAIDNALLLLAPAKGQSS